MEPMATNPLERVHIARDLLAEAEAVDEIDRLVQDQQEQLRLYTRETADTDEIKRLAAEIGIRGRRRIGQLLLRPSEDGERLRTPSEVGLDKDRATRARKLARLGEEEFETRLDEARERKETPSEKMFFEELPSPAKTPAERAYDSMMRWDWFIEQCQPSEFAELALEHSENAERILRRFREIAGWLTQAAEIGEGRLQQPMRVIEGKKARGA